MMNDVIEEQRGKMPRCTSEDPLATLWARITFCKWRYRTKPRRGRVYWRDVKMPELYLVLSATGRRSDDRWTKFEVWTRSGQRALLDAIQRRIEHTDQN